MLYVNISDGADPHAPEPAPAPEPPPVPPSQPKLMVTAYALERSYLAAGEKAALTVTVRNTSSIDQVKNIKLSFSEESGEIWPEGTGATYCTPDWARLLYLEICCDRPDHGAVETASGHDRDGIRGQHGPGLQRLRPDHPGGAPAGAA